MPKGMELFGDKALQRNFSTLGERVQRKVLRGAVNAASSPIVKQAKSNAAKESGLLRKSLGKKLKTYPEKMTVVGIVGPKTNVVGEYKGKRRRPALYAHLVERGHIDASGTFHPGQPFLSTAQASTESQQIGIMRDRLATGVVKEALKGAS